MANEWEEQWARVQRWFERFTSINEGRVHDRSSDYYQDEVCAFFQNCYHLKDWLKNDQAASAKVSDVEAFSSGSTNLRLCADLANGSKHLTLTTPRGDPNTRIGGRNSAVDLSSSLGAATDPPPTIAVKYCLVAGGNTLDATK